jgi:hypothetical protein
VNRYQSYGAGLAFTLAVSQHRLGQDKEDKRHLNFYTTCLGAYGVGPV